jgi:hypothetical protein
MVHICNPRYSGGTHKEDCSLRPAWAKICKTPSQQKSCVFVVNATQDTKAGTSQFEAFPGKKCETPSKIKLKQKQQVGGRV